MGKIYGNERVALRLSALSGKRRYQSSKRHEFRLSYYSY